MPRDITITLQDGSRHVYKNAPDNVTPDAVTARASKEFGQSIVHLDGGRSINSQSGPGVISDLAYSIPEGLVKGLTGLAGIPGDISNLVNKGMSAVGIPTRDPSKPMITPGAPDTTISGLVSGQRDGAGNSPTLPSGELGFGASGNSSQAYDQFPGKPYEAKTGAGKIADRIASFVPAVAGGEAGLGTRFMGRAVAPGIGSVAGENLGDENSPNLRTAGQIGGALLGAGAFGGARALSQAFRNGKLTPEEVAQSYVANVANSAGVQPGASLGASLKGQTAAEALGPTGVANLAALGRRGGDTALTLAQTLKQRAAGAPDRILEDYQSASGIAPEAAQGNMEDILAAGRAKAQPLYEEAFAGGSTAPLETQLRRALVEATGSKGGIAKQLKSIEQNSPGSLAARGAAGADTRAKYMELTDQLQQSEANRKATLEMFRKAQTDVSSNAPGAVWSPRVQQFLDDPVIKRGIAHGSEIQRLEALAAGKPYNPTEIGITGTDETGNPILSNVPNMRLLDAGKRGLDAQLESYRNLITRKLDLDEKGRAIEQVRQSYLGELDNLNPKYEAARGSAADYLSANSAFQQGGSHILNPAVPAAKAKSYFDALSEPNQNAYKAGIANKLFNQAQNGRLKPSQLLTPSAQDKITTVLGQEKGQQFIDGLQQEISLAQSGQRMMPGGGSITSDVLNASKEQDLSDTVRGASHFARAAGDVASNRYGSAIANALRGAYHFAPDMFRTGGMSEQARNAAGRMLMLPPEEFSQQLKALPAPRPSVGAAALAPYLMGTK